MDNIENTPAAFKDNETPKLKSASNCRACGTHITYKRLENGRFVAVQDDSNPHRCAEWKNWRAEG